MKEEETEKAANLHLNQARNCHEEKSRFSVDDLRPPAKNSLSQIVPLTGGLRTIIGIYM